MTAIKAQHGPQGVVFSSKSGSLSGHLFQLATAFDRQTPLRMRRHALPENRLPPK